MSDIKNTEMDKLRAVLDEIDDRIRLALLDRLSLCRRIAEYKKTNNIPMMQASRVVVVKDRAAAFAIEHGIDPGFFLRLYDVIISESCRIEAELIGPMADHSLFLIWKMRSVCSPVDTDSSWLNVEVCRAKLAAC